MEAEDFRRFLHQTRHWSRAKRDVGVLAMAAEGLRTYAKVDSGFFVYQQQWNGTDEPGKPVVYCAWGAFARAQSELEHLVGNLPITTSALQPMLEQWMSVARLRTLEMTYILRPYQLNLIGVWPITSREKMVGAMVVARRQPWPDSAANRIATAIVDACAAQISVALDLIRALNLAEEASQSDLLTGLLNRRGLEVQFQQTVKDATAKGQSVFFIIMDVDGLKEVNDGHGHPAGDALLRNVSSAIRKVTRHSDLACRYGGDEFVVVIQSTETSPGVVERLHRETEAMGCRVSLGVAQWGKDGRTLDECYRIADERLYREKRQRNCL